MLSSSSPVTASTISGGRAIPARSSTWISVASPRSAVGPELRLELLEALPPLLDERHLVPHARSERVMFAPTLPPPATIAYISRVARRGRRCRADDVGERRDRRLRRAHRRRPRSRRTPRGFGSRIARRRSRGRSGAAGPGRSRCSSCRRPSRRRQRRPSRARALEHLDIHPVADDEATAPFAEPRERASSSSTHVTSQPSPASSFATADPTRPHPTTTTFTRV